MWRRRNKIASSLQHHHPDRGEGERGGWPPEVLPFSSACGYSERKETQLTALFNLSYLPRAARQHNTVSCTQAISEKEADDEAAIANGHAGINEQDKCFIWTCNSPCFCVKSLQIKNSELSCFDQLKHRLLWALLK